MNLLKVGCSKHLEMSLHDNGTDNEWNCFAFSFHKLLLLRVCDFHIVFHTTLESLLMG